MNTNSILIFCFTVFAYESWAQNLVPNPSFEEVNFVSDKWCRKHQEFEAGISDWTSPNSGSPDLLDNKFLAEMSPARPGLHLTDVRARSGNISIGIKTYGCDNRVMHCREYVQVKLNEQVPKGCTIKFEYWICRTSTSIITNNFGAALSDTLVWQPHNTRELVVLSATHESKIVGEVPGKWYHISGEIVAEENCDYFLIGNFRADSETEIILPDSHLDYSFYLIDDVSVTIGDCPETSPLSLKLTLGNVMFEFDNWEITEDGRLAIKEFLAQLEGEVERLRITGHTDGVGGELYNLQLSSKRALAVKDIFVQLGVPKDVIQYEGVGARELIAERSSAENRRVEITME